MKILIVGSNHSNTAEYYKRFGTEPSVLVTSVDQQFNIGHTSPQDIGLEDLATLINTTPKVFWAGSSINEFYSEHEYYNFVNWLADLNRVKHITNLHTVETDPYRWNRPVSITEDDIVFLGCSFTAGTALPDPKTHYANIVGQHFNQRVVNLAEGSGSNGLVFDKFTQLDLHENQIVIVQLTSPNRLHYCIPDRRLLKIMFANSEYKDLNRAMLEVYHKDFLFYQTLTQVRAMVKIAEAKKLRMVFWLYNYKDEALYSQQDQIYFYNMKEFVPASIMADYFVDFATDNLHPGVESNKNIAYNLIKYIEETYNEI